MKKHNYRPPRPENIPYLRSLLVVEEVTDALELPVLPQGTAAMLCIRESAGKDPVRVLLFPRSIELPALAEFRNFSLLACFFQPFVFGPLFGIPATQLTVEPIEWPGASVTESLAAAGNTQELLEGLEAVIQKQALKNRTACETIRLATDWLMTRPATEPLSGLPAALNLSERSLQRLFRRYVGVSPLQFRHFCRFHDAFQQLRFREFDRLSDIAFEQGYADQSHFIRTFRKFTDLSPGEYVKEGLKRS